jgi:hypothetical protein
VLVTGARRKSSAFQWDQSISGEQFGQRTSANGGECPLLTQSGPRAAPTRLSYPDALKAILGACDAEAYSITNEAHTVTRPRSLLKCGGCFLTAGDMGTFMKGIFCSINDVGPSALEHLPLLCALTDNVILWQPSGSNIDKWSRANKTLPSKTELLALASDGIVHFGIRPEWLDSDHRKAAISKNPNIPSFDPDFEGANDFLTVAQKDNEKRIVRTIGYFYNEAEASVAKKDARYVRTKDFWESYSRSWVPNATIQRIDARAEERNLREAAYQEYAVTQLLRDAWLQSELLSYFDADVAFQNSRLDTITYASCYDQPTLSLPTSTAPTTLDDVTSLVVELAKISNANVYDKVMMLRSNKGAVQYFRRIVSSGCDAYMAVLDEEIRRAKKDNKDLIEAVFAAAGRPIGRAGLAATVVWAVIAAPHYFIDSDSISTSKIRESIEMISGAASGLLGLFAYLESLYNIKNTATIDEDLKILQVFSVISGDLPDKELIRRIARSIGR